MEKCKELIKMLVELIDRIRFWFRNRFRLIYA